MKIKTKLLIAFLFVTIVPLTIVGYVMINRSSEHLKAFILELTEEKISDIKNEIELKLNSFKDDVFFLRNTPPIDGIIRAKQEKGFDEKSNTTYNQWTQRLAKIFEALMETKDFYTQIRYIDENGQELVRVDSDGKTIIRIPKEQLQNKKDRYYFTETIRLAKDDFYASTLDLNRERRPPTIEIPHKPVIRFAAPVIDDEGKQRGIVIINVLGSILLESFLHIDQKQKDEALMLLDQDGFYLFHADKKKEWGGPKDLDTGKNFVKDFPQIASQMLFAEKAVVIGKEKIYGHAPVFPKDSDKEKFWIIVDYIPKNIVFLPMIILKNTLIIIIFLILGAGIILALMLTKFICLPIEKLGKTADKISKGEMGTKIDPELLTKNDEIGSLAKYFNKMASRLIQANTELAKKVKERTEELEKSKHSLEKKVIARTKELNEAREDLELKVDNRTKELSEQMKALEMINKNMIGREIKMVELKKEIAELKKKALLV